MEIEYYRIGYTGVIHKDYIDTENENYVSHTDTEVTFKDKDFDQYGDDVEDVVTHSRIFETVRLERVAAYKKQIERYQKDLSVFENSKDYDHYWELMGENR